MEIVNWGMIYFLILLFNYRRSLGGVISSIEFNAMSKNEKILALKMAFEKDLYSMYDLIYAKLEEIPSAEDYPKYDLAFEVAIAVKGSIDKSNGVINHSTTNFHCPFHADKHPSNNYNPIQHGFHCFSCSTSSGEVWDIFNLIGLIADLGSGEVKEHHQFSFQFKNAVNLYVDQTEGKVNFGTENFIPFTPKMNITRHNSYLNLIDIKDSSIGQSYLIKRGITLPTAQRLAVMVQHPKGPNGEDYGRDYIAFINGNGSYVRKLIYEDEELSKKCPYRANKWWNSKESGIFNEQVLPHCKNNNEICFVCESATDSLSCEELGYHAVALNSVSNANEFISHYVRESNIKFVCLADNDSAGKAMFQNFKNAMVFIPPYVEGAEGYALSKYKDVNDCLIADREGLKSDLEKLTSLANEYYKE